MDRVDKVVFLLFLILFLKNRLKIVKMLVKQDKENRIRFPARTIKHSLILFSKKPFRKGIFLGFINRIHL